jgi:hypothetical protein
MLVSTQTCRGHENAVMEHRRVPVQSKKYESLDKSTIADLSVTVVDGMSCDELIGVIGAAGLSTLLSDDFQGCLPLGDCETPRRLAHLARRCCQNQGY